MISSDADQPSQSGYVTSRGRPCAQRYRIAMAKANIASDTRTGYRTGAAQTMGIRKRISQSSSVAGQSSRNLSQT